MVVAVTYRVDAGLYHSPDIRHEAALVTTEYICGNELLVHLQIGKNLGIRLNNLMRYEFNGDKTLSDEQFMFKKTYRNGKPKPITRSTFEEKQRRFDMNRTTFEQEILEEYAYTDKTGCTSQVQIVVTVKKGTMTAAIDFKDAEQYQNFVSPAWLIRLS